MSIENFKSTKLFSKVLKSCQVSISYFSFTDSVKERYEISSVTELISYEILFRFATFSGMAGIFGGISVAFKQIMPDRKVDLMLAEIRVEVFKIPA